MIQYSEIVTWARWWCGNYERVIVPNVRLGAIALLLLVSVALPVVVVEGRDARPNVLLPPVVTALDDDRLLDTAAAAAATAIGSNALSSLAVVDGTEELLAVLLAKRVGIGATGKIGLGRSVNAGADDVDDDETCGNAG